MKDIRRDFEKRTQYRAGSRRVYRDALPQVEVTLSADLLKHLRTEARSMHVPLRWLVAGLICDTLKSQAELQGECSSRVC